MNTDLRQQIETALRAFSGVDLRAASIGLLSSLGYQSEKTLDLDNTPDAFLAEFDKRDRNFRKDKALFDRRRKNDKRGWPDIIMIYTALLKPVSAGKRPAISNSLTGSRPIARSISGILGWITAPCDQIACDWFLPMSNLQAGNRITPP
jgi:hypothetical protein